MNPGARRDVLAACGASDAVLDEVLGYTENPYAAVDTAPDTYPLPDEPHVDAWRDYVAGADRDGAFESLRLRFPQLRFPVRAGISADPAYRRATRQGHLDAADAFDGQLALADPSGLTLALHPSIGGHIPVLTAATREDFVTLVQAFTERNEPVPVPPSMGACIVNGLTNWDRVDRRRRAWLAEHPGADDAEWKATGFPAMAARKELYQDRFIILGRGRYSALPAEAADLSEDEWLARSLDIRLEHELTHYFTWRVFGRFRTHALDEILADFVGLVRAFGQYPGGLAARLLGVGASGEGRLRNYQGTLSDEAFAVVAALSARAVANLERLSASLGFDLEDTGTLARAVYALAGLHLEALAAEDAGDRFEQRFAAAGGRLAVRRRTLRIFDLTDPVTAVNGVLRAFNELATGDAALLAAERDVHLVIDEVISNLVIHAGTADRPANVRCELVRYADSFEVMCVDDGPAFDPLQRRQAGPAASIEELPVGGLGILLVRRLMSDVHYERRGGRNRLRLTLRLTPQAAG